MKKKEYNLTELPVSSAIDRGISHRDYWAHALRFNHVLNLAKIGMNILDFGAGEGNMYEVFYRNRYSPQRYLGLDVREKSIQKMSAKFPMGEWKTEDLVKMESGKYGQKWDIITCFETLEHVGKQNVPKVLDNIKSHANQDTIILISTPCYDGTAAGNHTYDSGDGRGIAHQELTYDELKKLLEERFEIVEHYGTFASQKSYKDKMNEHQTWMFDKLKNYYDSNILSILFAPMFPEFSRNVIWKCKLKK